MRTALIAAAFFFILPAARAAACTVTAFSPDEYNQASDPIYATTDECTDELGLYLEGSTTLPYAYANNLGADYGVVNLNDVVWTTGGFSQANQPIGTYNAVAPQSLSCYNLSYAACAAANANIPGSQQADFSIIASSSATSTATSTLTASDRVLTYLFFLLDALWFAAVAVFLWIALAYVFKI